MRPEILEKRVLTRTGIIPIGAAAHQLKVDLRMADLPVFSAGALIRSYGSDHQSEPSVRMGILRSGHALRTPGVPDRIQKDAEENVLA